MSFQDAFCYVRKYGRPDLFITMTTNPKWDEIVRELFNGQTSHCRHDIVSRVFHLKMNKLMHLLIKDNIFGESKCFIYSVEWQKRGLPHVHILLWLKEKIRPNQIDNVINAELPDENNDQILYRIIKSHMIHGPCGAHNPKSPCMKEGKCSKGFPKQFVEETMTNEGQYPLYRRRQPKEGKGVAKIYIGGNIVDVDNRWIVPYSPVLSRTFKTHINVESCNSVTAIKYILKYVNKGSDQATFCIKNQYDEIIKYQSGRYISTSEAVWRILSFPIHERFPPVMHLDVHLENRQRIYFNNSNIRDRIENQKNTTLLAFFQICNEDQFAKTLLYEEIPMYYTFNKQQGRFIRRKKGILVSEFTGIYRDNVIGRVYTVHPNNNDCYYLRLLLHNVRRPTSFKDIKSVDNIEYPTYQAACAARHLLDDDKHWDETLKEACITDNPGQLRQLFAIMLIFCQLNNPLELWNKYSSQFCEDVERELIRNITNVNVDNYRVNIENAGLIKLQEKLISIGGRKLDEYGLPSPQEIEDEINYEYNAEINYNIDDMKEYLNQNEQKLTKDQKKNIR